MIDDEIDSKLAWNSIFVLNLFKYKLLSVHLVQTVWSVSFNFAENRT